jgi:hypothetical protein
MTEKRDTPKFKAFSKKNGLKIGILRISDGKFIKNAGLPCLKLLSWTAYTWHPTSFHRVNPTYLGQPPD